MEEYKVELTEVTICKKTFWKKADSEDEAIVSVKTMLQLGAEDRLERSPKVYIESPIRFDFKASKVKYKEN